MWFDYRRYFFGLFPFSAAIFFKHAQLFTNSPFMTNILIESLIFANIRRQTFIAAVSKRNDTHSPNDILSWLNNGFGNYLFFDSIELCVCLFVCLFNINLKIDSTQLNTFFLERGKKKMIVWPMNDFVLKINMEKMNYYSYCLQNQ